MSPAHARLNELTARMDSTHTDFEAEKKARSSVMELKVSLCHPGTRSVGVGRYARGAEKRCGVLSVPVVTERRGERADVHTPCGVATA